MTTTTSLCPTCYSRIPAQISVRDGSVFMDKECPQHGQFSAMVERNADFFTMVKALPNQSIYNGLLVDITGECNLSCAVCLHDKTLGALPAEEVIAYCREHADLQPFFLSGGEPTLHPELFQIIKGLQTIGGGGVGIITNGLKLLDRAFLQALGEVFTTEVLPIAFSVHPQADIKQAVIDNFRAIGRQLSLIFWVITSVDEIPGIMEFYRANQDVVCQVRIKAATNVWSTQHVDRRIFVSDILDELQKIAPVYIDTAKGNKTTAINCVVDGLPFMAVAWYDKTNIDLEDIDCPPYYKGKDGVIRDFLSASILNELPTGGTGDDARLRKGVFI